jgi:hypothetical protein
LLPSPFASSFPLPPGKINLIAAPSWSKLIEVLSMEFQSTTPIYLKKKANSFALITFKLKGNEIASINFSDLKRSWEEKIILIEDPLRTANGEKR